jgi:outer membrane protein assembly factor BamB
MSVASWQWQKPTPPRADGGKTADFGRRFHIVQPRLSSGMLTPGAAFFFTNMEGLSMHRRRMLPRLAICALGILTLVPAARADNWPAWRGPGGQGHCAEKNLPLKWSATENVRWKIALPGSGNSTPIVWGDEIFVTQADDKTLWPPRGGNGGPAIARKRSLLCFARADGKLVWQKDVTYEAEESTHPTNPFCSASPATDGERVVVSHGSAGLFCYDQGGKEIWKKDLGKCEHIWGNGASPVLYRDLVILNFGPGERTFLIALDKKTGEQVWKVEEAGGKKGDQGQAEWIGSWSTPIVVNVSGHDELIMSWAGVVKAYDPKSGELLWSCKGLEKDKGQDRLTYTSPIGTDQVIVSMAGFGGAWLAVKPGGKGDVTETRRLWREPRAPQRIGSGVIVGDYVYIVNEPGTAQCIEWKTGHTLWTERVGGSSWGSIVHAGDRLYVTNLEGETIVLAAKPEFEVLATNPLKERTLASIAVSNGEIFIRTYQHLWCIASKKAEDREKKGE